MAPAVEKKSDEKDKSKEEPKKDDNEKAKKNDKSKKEPEISEEDKQLQEELSMLVERLSESDKTLYKPALESLRSQIRASTSSMTSVPKPLKFLRQHYATLKSLFDQWEDDDNRKSLADIISVLGMTAQESSRDCLKYRFLGSTDSFSSWGHEYVRHLAEEIRDEFNERQSSSKPTDDLIKLASEIVPYDLSHNAEIDACDLAMEVERLDLLEEHVDKATFQRVCLYLTSCVNYVPEPEDSDLIKVAVRIFLKFECQPDALILAIRLNDMALVKSIFTECTGTPEKQLVQKQMAYILGRLQIFLELDDEMEGADELAEIISNSHLNNSFLSLARELDIMEPKEPEDIYKSHLDARPFSTSSVSMDSARQNLASSFVNGFVNAAFGTDKLLSADDSKWLYKNKEHGMMSAAASLGLILLWDVDGGLTQIDKYLYSNEDYIKNFLRRSMIEYSMSKIKIPGHKAGALLACGIVSSGVRNDFDPALALLSDYVQDSSSIIRIGAIQGIGLAYAGSNREDVLQVIMPVLVDSKLSMEVVGVAAVAAGLVAIGSCNGELTSVLLQTMMERSEKELSESHSFFLALGLGLTYLAKQDAVEATLETLKVLPDPFGKWACVLTEVCAYAGTGNVLQIQNLLHICSEHFEKDKEDKEKDSKDKKETKEEATETHEGLHQGIATLGIAAIAMGEDIGTDMAMRAFNHLLQYGEPVIRRSVPLALALLSASNPRLSVIDTLSKLSHDHDAEVAHNSIFAMGIIGAGSNNARLAGMLRQLALYYHKDSNNLFMVRLAQGLVHLGKGTLSMSPYQYDRTFMSPVAVGGLLATLIGFLDVKHLVLGKSHYILYNMVAAMQARMLVTLDKELKPLPVTVRVGQSVDVVGQAGKPKTITGFQTHTTPVLLAHGERAELATEEYISLTPVMEGFVVLKKNPIYDAEEHAER